MSVLCYWYETVNHVLSQRQTTATARLSTNPQRMENNNLSPLNTGSCGSASLSDTCRMLTRWREVMWTWMMTDDFTMSTAHLVMLFLDKTLILFLWCFVQSGLHMSLLRTDYSPSYSGRESIDNSMIHSTTTYSTNHVYSLQDKKV